MSFKNAAYLFEMTDDLHFEMILMDLFWIYFRLILGKTVVLKWFPLSFWYDRSSFRYDKMTDISRWYITSRIEMMRGLSFRQGLDFWPSVYSRNDKHISCHKRKRAWHSHHIKGRIIEKSERHFLLMEKKENIDKRVTAKNSRNSIISKGVSFL